MSARDIQEGPWTLPMAPGVSAAVQVAEVAFVSKRATWSWPVASPGFGQRVSGRCLLLWSELKLGRHGKKNQSDGILYHYFHFSNIPGWPALLSSAAALENTCPDKVREGSFTQVWPSAATTTCLPPRGDGLELQSRAGLGAGVTQVLPLGLTQQPRRTGWPVLIQWSRGCGASDLDRG